MGKMKQKRADIISNAVIKKNTSNWTLADGLQNISKTMIHVGHCSYRCWTHYTSPPIRRSTPPAEVGSIYSQLPCLFNSYWYIYMLHGFVEMITERRDEKSILEDTNPLE